jgi:hypothetical protein
MDLVYIALTVAFFAAAVAYVAGCDQLAAVAKASAPNGGDRS